MRKKSYQSVGDRLTLAQSAANVTFVTDGELSPGSTVAHETFPEPFAATPLTAAALNSRPDAPGMLPTKQRGRPKETSRPRHYGAMRNQHREVVGGQQKSTPSAAEETFLTEEELAARWSISAKTLRNSRITGRLIGFVKIGRSVRYRLSEIITYELQNSVRSTSGGNE
jgi:hypothetical protein